MTETEQYEDFDFPPEQQRCVLLGLIAILLVSLATCPLILRSALAGPPAAPARSGPAPVRPGAAPWKSPGAPRGLLAAPTETYQGDVTTAAYRTALTGADGTDLSDAAGVGAITTGTTGGAPTVTVSARFSGSSGDTCAITFLRGYATDAPAWTTHGVLTITATAGAFTDANGDNVAPDIPFDTGGSPHYKVLVGAPSAGDVDLWTTKTVQ